jgi:hypothetical protein
MSDNDFNRLVGYTWMQSRIPALDGLVTFIPDGPRDPAVASFATGRRSRWYPVEGGMRVVVLYDDDSQYDADRWHVEKGAWDHEHCELCRTSIPPMMLCWVTKSDPYVLLCDDCHSEVFAAAGGA